MDTRIHIDGDTLLDLVHDRYFDLTECEFDRERREYRLSFGDQGKGPYAERLLKVTDVPDVSIRDEAQIGIYDINYIEIAPPMVTIVSAFPLQITLTVGDEATIFIREHPSRHGRGGERRAAREEASEGSRWPWWRLMGLGVGE
jgi:hypothetical protein